MIRVILIFLLGVVSSIGCLYVHENQLFDAFSLQCTHEEFNEIQKWFMFKKKFAGKLPLEIFEEPWYSYDFGKHTKVKHLSQLGVLKEATPTNLIFSGTSKYENLLIQIDRVSLRLKLKGNGTSSYSCTKRTPEYFYLAVEKMLQQSKRKLKI